MPAQHLPDNLDTLVLYCRAGFESDCALEVQTKAAELGIYGYCKTGEAYVCFVPADGSSGVQRLLGQLHLDQLVFARQWYPVVVLANLDRDNRLGPLFEALAGWPRVGQLVVEYPDTNDGKALVGLGKSLSRPLLSKLQKQNRLTRKPRLDLPTLFVFLVAGDTLMLGWGRPDEINPHPMGIRRLKFPKEAPSRSTLKLEEAWHQFIPADQWDQQLAPGMKAVDLGAAPGGWTWQLVQRHMMVTAVDNGPMNADLMESGQVEHVREDGYAWQPSKGVEWMVCDIVDKPARTADMVIQWLLNGWCRQTIFNLKLPMKKRWDAVDLALSHIQSALDEAGLRYQMACKHLYHDREEVTVYIWRQS